MGAESTCRVEIGGQAAEARALLETGEIIIRGALKARIPFREAQAVAAEDGVLLLRWNERDVRIHVGADAAKWADKIRKPRSLLDKLGIKRGQKVTITGTVDSGFAGELESSGVDLSRRLRKGSDVIFFPASRREELDRLARLRLALAPAGAIWVLRPRGDPAISERDVMNAGKAAGLVDVKVVRFSETHTAEKFIIPLAKRS